MNTIYNETIDLLSRAIMNTLGSQRQEEYYPNANPDYMDSKIIDAKNRVKFLRRIRDEYEDEMSKPLGVV